MAKTLEEAWIFKMVEARLSDLSDDSGKAYTELSAIYNDNNYDTDIRSLIKRLQHAQVDAEAVVEDIAYVLNKLHAAIADDDA